MKVKMLVSRAGPAGVAAPGDVIDVEAAEGTRMIDAGQCVPVRTVAVETATRAAAPENAAAAIHKPRRRK